MGPEMARSVLLRRVAARPSFVALAALLAMATLPACGDDDDAGGEAPSHEEESEPRPDCEPERTMDLDGADLGDRQTFQFGGHDRSYLLAAPSDYDGSTAYPLLFNFHGHGGTAAEHGAQTQLAAKGTDRGYIVVTPDALGTPQAWNFGRDAAGADDFGFVNALYVDLSGRLCIDAARVYAAGHSNGSAFTGFLACTPPYRFAAAAMVAAFIPPTCDVDVATPSVLAIHGTADPGVPYDGGLVVGGPAQIPAARATLDVFRDQYRCEPTVIEEELAPSVQRRAYNGCLNGAEVELYTVVDGAHEWPGSEASADLYPDNEGQAFPASDAILDFFDTH
jgi:polyhydroxybutyrate depolymerase